ncbi:hypothetical protein DOY81_014074 [Sarcophaga bullata]|nr:hypothetical protein DOY81_014074 [Sarcophaga bullata]
MNKSSSIAGVDSSTYSNVNLNMESEKSNNTAADAGGSLSSAITEELKKRKAEDLQTGLPVWRPGFIEMEVYRNGVSDLVVIVII